MVAGLKGGARLKKAQLGGGAKKPGLGGMIQRARSAGVNKAAAAAPKKSGMTGMVANAVASQARNKAAKPQSPNRGYVKTGVQTTPPRKRMAAAKRKPAQPTSGPKPRLGW